MSRSRRSIAAIAAIGTSLDRLVKKEKLSAQDAAALRARIRGTTEYAQTSPGRIS